MYSGNTPSRLKKENFQGAINWISSGELKEHYIKESKEKISKEAIGNLRLLPIGTFIIAIYGLEAEGVRGTGSILQQSATISQACMAFLPKNNVSNEFLYCWYKKHGNIIGVKYAQGTKQQNLSYDILGKFKVYYPKLQEQAKLEYFISLLDERIATQNKIIDKLESLIKGIRSKLYKNLIGKEIFLGDISDIYQPKTISSTELIDRGFPVYGANGIIGYYDQYNHEMEQICITCRGNTCGTINFSQQKSWITGNAMVVNTDNYKDIVDKRYLFHLLVDYNFNNIISGSGQPQIVRTPLEKIKIKLPIIGKQKQIAKSLDSILQKIDLEKYSLSLLNLQKQYLLRQMFI